MINYGSTMVTKVPKYYRPKGDLGVVLNNKDQAAKILVQDNKWVRVECNVDNSPSKFA